MPQYGSRCKAIDRRAASGRGPVLGTLEFGNRPDEDTGVAFWTNIATTLRRSHAIPRPAHRSICSCKLKANAFQQLDVAQRAARVL